MFKGRGFTDRIAVCILILLTIGMGLSYVLAIKSIETQYTGALSCWTVCFTPIGTALSIVLTAIVQKNRAENTSADGDGINYRRAMDKLQNGGPTI